MRLRFRPSTALVLTLSLGLAALLGEGVWPRTAWGLPFGDFNGDGKADILWRHSSGVVYEWLLDGTTVIGAGSPGGADNDWEIQ